jgi:hypothetical protein
MKSSSTFSSLVYIIDYVGRRRAAAVLLLLALLAAVLEVVGMGLVLPFLVVVNDAEAIQHYPSMQKLSGWLGVARAEDLPIAFGALLLAFFSPRTCS